MSRTPIQPSRRAVVLGLMSSSLLAGCARYYYGDRYGPLLEDGSGQMLEKSTRAAVDRLLGRGAPVPGATVRVMALTETGRGGRSSGFGRVVAAQLASELAERGVALAPQDQASAPGSTDWQTLDAAMQSRGAAVQLEGNYTVAARVAYVSLRLTGEGGRLLSAVDYTVPLEPDVNALLRTQ